MNIVAFRTLRTFYEKHRDCEQQLKTWDKEASSSDWRSPEEIKELFASASILKANRVVFNIKGNKYRLIVAIAWKQQALYIKFLGTLADYDRIDATTIEPE